MESNRVFLLADESFPHTVSDLREWFEDVEILPTRGIDDLLSRIGEVDCVLASVPVSQIDFGQLSDVPVIVWRNPLPAADAVRMSRAGAFQCFDGTASVEDVRDSVGAAIEQSNARAARRRQPELVEKWRASLVGEGAAMARIAETIRLVAPRKCTVLISGETGTGKEMAARAVHLASPRAHMPMVSVNCTALPENLLEAELFGHTKGAFTGATSHRIGRFEQANKSTLFLDEIGDMPLELQAKLLRVLQEMEFQRLGCSETIKVDVRVIAASNVDLLARVREGRFREDLYYRLNVVPLIMPPLRARKEDLPALIRHFIVKICRAENIELKRLAPGAYDALCDQPWPGNIRQLENTIEMAIALSGDREVLNSLDFGLQSVVARVPLAEVPAQELFSFAQCGNFETAVSQFEWALLNNALQSSGGNKSVASERLGIKRTTLIMKLKNLEKTSLFNVTAGDQLGRPPEVAGWGRCIAAA